MGDLSHDWKCTLKLIRMYFNSMPSKKALKGTSQVLKKAGLCIHSNGAIQPDVFFLKDMSYPHMQAGSMAHKVRYQVDRIVKMVKQNMVGSSTSKFCLELRHALASYVHTYRLKLNMLQERPARLQGVEKRFIIIMDDPNEVQVADESSFRDCLQHILPIQDQAKCLWCQVELLNQLYPYQCLRMDVLVRSTQNSNMTLGVFLTRQIIQSMMMGHRHMKTLRKEHEWVHATHYDLWVSPMLIPPARLGKFREMLYMLLKMNLSIFRNHHE